MRRAVRSAGTPSRLSAATNGTCVAADGVAAAAFPEAGAGRSDWEAAAAACLGAGGASWTETAAAGAATKAELGSDAAPGLAAGESVPAGDRLREGAASEGERSGTGEAVAPRDAAPTEAETPEPDIADAPRSVLT
jgi:hypothetical protein